MNIFHLPDLGEGLPDAEISAWHVKVGDTINVDDPLVAMETAKAVVEVPSPRAGTISKLYGKPGDIIQTGAPLVEFSTIQQQLAERNAINASNSSPNNRTSSSANINDSGTVAGKIEVGDTILEEAATGVRYKRDNIEKHSATNNLKNIKATPAIRALASSLGVDLASVTATGANGTITANDVQTATTIRSTTTKPPPGYQPLTGVRRTMAQAMVQAQQTIVPVTIMDDAILANWSAKADITVRVIQAIVAAVQQEPALNAWFDGGSLSRKLLAEIDLGIACDTEEGLFVPVIKNVAKLSATELRTAIDNVKHGVQNRTLTPTQLRGATFTLSNFGKFAGRYANPIIVPPQVAILGVGAIREEVVAINGTMQISRVLPLTLSFDHRACTGGEATRFLGAVLTKLGSCQK